MVLAGGGLEIYKKHEQALDSDILLLSSPSPGNIGDACVNPDRGARNNCRCDFIGAYASPVADPI